MLSPFPSPAASRLLRTGLLLVVLLTSVPACVASGGGGRGGWDSSDSRAQVVELQVTNLNFKDARIYTLWDGERRRVGTVGGNTSRTFKLQWRAGAVLRIEVDFLAGGGFVSSGVTTWPGEQFEFVIPSNI